MIIWYLEFTGLSADMGEDLYFFHEENARKKFEEYRKEMKDDPTFREDEDGEDGHSMETDTARVILRDLYTADEP